MVSLAVASVPRRRAPSDQMGWVGVGSAWAADQAASGAPLNKQHSTTRPTSARAEVDERRGKRHRQTPSVG